MDNVVDRHVFYIISDGTAITAKVGSRGYVAVSGDDQRHHAAIRGKRKSRPRRQGKLTPFISKPAFARWCLLGVYLKFAPSSYRRRFLPDIVRGAGGAASARDETGSDANRSSYFHGLIRVT